MADGRRTPAFLAIVITLVVAAVAIGFTQSARGPERLVTLGVGEVVEIDPGSRDRWRLTALSTDLDGVRTLFVESLGRSEVGSTIRLREGTPNVVGAFEISLRDVRLDPARGTAVQLQWIPADPSEPRALFSVTGEEPVTLPADLPATIEVAGPIPPPGGGVLALVVRKPGAEPIAGRLEQGGRFPVGRDGELTWIGTSERWLTTIAIRQRRPA